MAFPYHVCAGLQDNGSWCGPSRHRQGAVTNADWITIGGGDGFYTAQDPTDPNIVYSESQGGNMGRLNLATGERTSLQKPNWRPRYQLFEDSILIEHPDTTKPPTAAQQKRLAELRRRQLADSAEADLRWNWNTPFFLSAHSPTTFYVTFDGHRTNDFAPYVYITTDFGKTFAAITHTLPTGGPDYVHVVREDPFNRNLLYVGTDVGAYISRDRGTSWQKFMTGMPTVPVHDLKIHPREHELMAATHGRGIWIVDVTPLEQLAESVLAASAYLFEPKTAYEYGDAVRANASGGHKQFISPSPQYGAEIVYRLTTGDRRTQTKVVISDVRGDTVRTVNGPGGPGLHRVAWGFQGRLPSPQPSSPSQRRDSTLLGRRIQVVFA